MKMQRELSSFPLPPSHRQKLQAAGFETVEDLVGVKPSELVQELSISPEEALGILKTTVDDPPERIKELNSQSQTALDMLQDEQGQRCIITFSEQLDGILGGGIPLTKITEICGAPGIGKTQLCMQLATDVQIPECFGGVEGEAVYIDTEGSFIIERMADIARAAVSHCQHLAQAEPCTEHQTAMCGFNIETILSHLYYFRCRDHTELLALSHILPEFLQTHPQVKLVVVDSIAFHFRHDFDDFSLRTRLLNGMAQAFIKMATKFKLAVVLTNQMTTKISQDTSKPSQLIPALGESWGHAATVRIILFWKNSQRNALLYKSPSRQEATVPYQITTGGIRDIDQTSSGDVLSDEEHSPHLPRKRLCTDNR